MFASVVDTKSSEALSPDAMSPNEYQYCPVIVGGRLELCRGATKFLLVTVMWKRVVAIRWPRSEIIRKTDGFHSCVF